MKKYLPAAIIGAFVVLVAGTVWYAVSVKNTAPTDDANSAFASVGDILGAMTVVSVAPF